MSEYDLSKFDKVVSDIVTIQDKGNFLPDCSTKEGYEASKRFVLDVTAKAKKALTDAHKETKKPFWDTCKFLDGKKNELMPILETVESPHKIAYKAKDQEKKEEKARFDAMLQGKIQVLIDYRSQTVGKSSSEITEMIQSCGETDTEEGFYNRAADAATARSETLAILDHALMIAVQSEAMAKQKAELEAQQCEMSHELAISMNADFDRDVIDKLASEKADAEQRELDRLEREKQLIEQATTEANAKAERAKQAELEAIERAKQQKIQAEKDKLEAEAQAKRQAELVEKQRVAAEKKAKQDQIDAAERAKNEQIAKQQAEEKRLTDEAAAREANKAHKAKVNNVILTVLMANGISEKDGKTMIKLAAKREIPQLTINY